MLLCPLLKCTTVRQYHGPLFTRVWIYDLEPYSSRLSKLTRLKRFVVLI